MAVGLFVPDSGMAKRDVGHVGQAESYGRTVS